VLQVKSVHQREVLYCLHESGSVSAKFRRRQLAFVGSPLDVPAGSVCSLGKFFFFCREASYKSVISIFGFEEGIYTEHMYVVLQTINISCILCCITSF
jgi:hypothetical protein